MNTSSTDIGQQTDDQPLSQKLLRMIEELPPSGVTLDHLLLVAGDDGLMLLVALLSLVFLIPVSIPGVSTVFGGAILLIALCSLARRPLWLPERLRSKALSTEKLKPVLQRASRWIGHLEKISRPGRMNWLLRGRAAHAVTSAGMVLGALLLMAPFGLIPFSNTIPAIALLCFAVGLIQRDGLCIILGHLANLASILYFGILLAGGGLAIREAFRHFAG